MSSPLADWLRARRAALTASEPEQSVALADAEPLFDALLAAAEGDTQPLGVLVSSPDSLTPPPSLHGLLQTLAELRRAARDLPASNGHHDATEHLAVFDALLDQAAVTLARHWEEQTATTLQERLSQAEFVAESLAQATEEADNAALQLSMLNELAQRMTALLDHDQLVETVGARLFELLGAEHLAIYLVEAQQLRLARAYGHPAAACATFAWNNDSASPDLVQRAVSCHLMIFDALPDAAEQGAWYLPGYGVLAVPLIVGGDAIGVVVAQDARADETLGRARQSLAVSVAAQAAIALQNARLYDEIRHFNAELEQRIAERTRELQEEHDRLETLYEIAMEVGSTLNLDLLLNSALDSLARLTGVRHGSIMLLDLETEHLVDRATLGNRPVGFTRFPVGAGLAGWVAQQKKAVRVDDVTKDERWITRTALAESYEMPKQSGSIIAVPLIAQEQMLGVLTLSHDQVGYFDDDHLRLLNVIGSQIGIAAHNALLYDQIFSEVNRRGELLRHQELESSKNAAILQSLTDGVVVCETDGAVLLVNTAAERMLERSMSDMLVWNLRDMLLKLVPARLNPVEALDDLLRTPLDRNEQPRVARIDFQIGTRTISLTMGPVLTARGELLGAVALFRDVTREVESDRMKTEFIGTVSHELRTPMTSIKGYTQLLAMGSLGEINDTQREFLTTIQSNAERMITIINDLLDITKIETGSVELEIYPHPLADIVSSVVGEQRALIVAREQELAINLLPSLPPLLVDSRALHKIMGNLLSNAVKYTPRAGRITIEAHEVVVELLPEAVAEQLRPGRRWVQINISDTGVGIASHEQQLVFDRFYRTDNPLKIEAGGTGLGLALVRSLIQLLGGQIWLQSVLNEGTTVSLVVPAV